MNLFKYLGIEFKDDELNTWKVVNAGFNLAIIECEELMAAEVITKNQLKIILEEQQTIQRIEEVESTISRFRLTNRKVPKKWTDELGKPKTKIKSCANCKEAHRPTCKIMLAMNEAIGNVFIGTRSCSLHERKE